MDVSPTLPEGYSFSVSQPRRHSSTWCRWLSWDYSEDYESAVSKDNSTLWKSLRLLLLRQFLHRYNCTTRIYDGFGWQHKSFFVFRQLVYALVSIAHEANIIRFRERPASYEMGIGGPIDATPSWEPPTTDSYWIGDVLIVLDPDMYRRADHHAALVDAIQLGPGHKKTTAIVFSTSDVTAFEVHSSPDEVHISQISGRGGVFGNPQRACCICCCTQEPTPSLLLLIDILASASAKVHPPRSYPALPVEICETIYDCAPPATQRALRASCRLFNTFFQRINRDIQVGEWRLKASPGRCPSRYSGTSGQGSSLEDVDLKTGHLKAESGYEVGILTEKGAIELDLSLFGIVKATDEDCCKNYPETEDSLDAGCPPRCTAHYHQGYSGISSSQVGLCGDVMGLWGELGERSRQKVSGEWCEMGWREVS